MNYQDALLRLDVYLQPYDDPCLSQLEVDTLLDANALTVDVDGLTPSDDGYTPTYSVIGLYRAAAEGWTVKAGKAAGRFDFTTDGQQFRRSQIVDHCEGQAAKYRRKTNLAAPC